MLHAEGGINAIRSFLPPTHPPTQERPPAVKRPRIEVTDSETAEEMEVENGGSKKGLMQQTESEDGDDSTPPKPIKQSTLDLDDIPVELLTKHKEFMLKQVSFLTSCKIHCL